MPFSRIVAELQMFFFPLRKALISGGNLSEFLAYFGYDLSSQDASDAMADLTSLGDAVESVSDLLAAVVQAAAGGSFQLTPQQQAEIVEAAKDVYEQVDGIGAAIAAVVGSPPGPEFPLEIIDRLIDLYLGRRAPPLREVMAVLAVRVINTRTRTIAYSEVRYDFVRFGQLISDTGTWADEVYGWGRDFDHIKAIVAAAHLIETFGGRVFVHPMSDGLRTAMVQNVPLAVLPPGMPPSSKPVAVSQADLPLVTLAQGGAIAQAGLTLMPFGDMANRADLGLALAPFVQGSVAARTNLSDNLTFEFSASASATGGRSITLRPSGLGTTGAGAADAEFSASLVYRHADASPILFIGSAGGTRVQADGLLAATGGSMAGDLFIAAGIRGLTAVIDPGDDGLLSALIPDPIIIKAGDILVGVRPGRGVYFEGGTSLSVDVPLDIDLNLLRIMGLGVKLDWSSGFAIDTTIEGELTIGPLYAYADGIGIRTKVVKRRGLLGENDLEFGFIPPRSYAVSLDLSPVEGGGLIELGDKEYRGALALKFQSIGFSAFGILNTELPGGQPGFSFAASIFGEFNLPLGYGFFLTGLGGIIGINRTIDTGALRDVLYEGRLDNLLFPADPIANAATILDDMAAILPAREGQHVFGPVARIGWGVPTLVAIKLGVVIEVGSEVRLLILGGLSCELPTPEAALVSLKLSFFGEIDFNAGTISFDATLQGSRILTFALSGDVALRTGWAPGIEHIISFGGLHPQFPRPANLPDLRRISLDFGTNNPRITVSGYTAITLNSLQFGADLQLYAKGPKIIFVGQLAAEGWAYFNALIIFDPFAFSANLGGGLKLLVDGETVCGLGFDVTLTGPNRFTIDGKVWVTVFGVDIDFAIRHSWGSPESLPPTIADPAQVLRAALEAVRIEPVAATGGGAVRYLDIDPALAVLDPAGGARLSQNRLPLGVRIERIGEGTIPGGALADIRLSRAGQPLTGTTPVTADFVHGHYFQTTQAEKLRATAYDRLKAGVTLASPAVDSDGAFAISATCGYEVIPIPLEDAGGNAAAPGGGTLVIRPELLDRVVMAGRLRDPEEVFRLDTRVNPPDLPSVDPARFTTQQAMETVIRATAAGTAATTVLPEAALFDTFAEAGIALGRDIRDVALLGGDQRLGLGAAVAGPVPAYFAMAAY